jgi:hypothetical protein
METQSPRITYYENSDFKFEYERAGNEVCIHCEIYNWKLSVLRFGYSVISSLLEECRDRGVEIVYTISPNPKFAKIYGGRSVKTFTLDNKEYEIVIWDLRQQP